MDGLRQISFADFLSERKEKFEPDDERLFALKKIEKIDFARGNIHLGKYKPTKTKQIIVEPGDFVFSGLNIEKGAVSVNDTGEQLVVSANYSTCRVDYSQIDQRFLAYFMRSPNFKSMLIENLKKDYGFTRPKHLMPLSFTIPASLNEQRSVVERIQCHENEGKALIVEITHQQTLLKKLRQQILQEAIEGKLTADWRAENPNVEPASELLARIKAEKETLIQAKKIKKQKPLPPITDKEKPFDLPDGWVWCRYGDVMLDIEAGKSPACYNYPAGSNEWGVLKISAISWDLFREDENKKLKPNVELFADKEVKSGDFIMTRANTKDLVAKSVIVNDVRPKLLLNDKTLRVHFSEKVSLDYMNLFNNGEHARSHYISVATGASPSMKNISRDNIKGLGLPLPPFPEQQAIVAKVEKLFAICDQLEAQITQNQTHAEALMQAVLKEAFQQAGGC